ncbi:MAG: hypothetical protein GXP04_00915 [Alphaproteobacteria bacterium]|nr:hypothetical protein [Marinicaulis sp.]NOX93687.1 hypothetical protein [Alphaproteobacteria bacterium]
MSETGILVIAYARPKLLRLVLESLKRQNALSNVNVWIDGNAGRKELAGAPKRCSMVAEEFQVAHIRSHSGHLGIEKLMIDALAVMMDRYDKIIILEDDCFPTSSAVAEFDSALNDIRDDKTLFSVYGHHFDVPGERPRFSRFQGWGWATWAEKLKPVHKDIKQLFLLNEEEYLLKIKSMASTDVIDRLDRTPPRYVLRTAMRQFSWDSCLAVVTASGKLDHAPTHKRVVFNCGLDNKHGHFAPKEALRNPPFNMIGPNEVWAVFET